MTGALFAFLAASFRSVKWLTSASRITTHQRVFSLESNTWYFTTCASNDSGSVLQYDYIKVSRGNFGHGVFPVT